MQMCSSLLINLNRMALASGLLAIGNADLRDYFTGLQHDGQGKHNPVAVVIRMDKIRTI
jgi:hypothetical protein